jgi:hypothetical protein
MSVRGDGETFESDGITVTRVATVSGMATTFTYDVTTADGQRITGLSERQVRALSRAYRNVVPFAGII